MLYESCAEFCVQEIEEKNKETSCIFKMMKIHTS